MSGPSFYGEVLPQTSRAVDDDEDQDDSEVCAFSSSVLRWSPNVQTLVAGAGSIPCNVLIIAIESVATGFVQTYFLHEEVERIGVICSGLSGEYANTFSQDSFTDETCYIYRLKAEPTTLFCQCKAKVLPEQAFAWVNQLFSGISKVHTYLAVLSHKSVHEYTSETTSSELKVPFLRALRSGYFHGVPICDYLEQPNIIDGLPAQIMTYCQVNRIPAVYYNCFTENIYLDIPAMKEFTKLLSVTPFKDFYQINAEADMQLKNLVQQQNRQNMLYM